MDLSSVPDLSQCELALSVVVPVRNESRFIESTLHQLIGQSIYPSRYEILVVDGRSEDGTAEIVRKFADDHPDAPVFLIDNPVKLSSAARNLGVRAARGEYILIIDGHVQIPSRTLLDDAYRVANESGAMVLGRPQRLTPDGMNPAQKLIAAVRASRIGHSAESYVFSSAEGWVPPGSIGVMYSREAFLRFGLFDERFDAAEDYEFNTRLEDAGVRCYTSPKLEVLYYPRSSIGGLFRQMLRYGIGRGRMLRKQRKVRSISSILPAIAVVIGVVLLSLAMIVPAVRWLLICLAACYAIIVGLVYISSSQLRGFPLWKVFAAAVAIHSGAGIGFLRGAFRRLDAQQP